MGRHWSISAPDLAGLLKFGASHGIFDICYTGNHSNLSGAVSVSKSASLSFGSVSKYGAAR
jgi:hypothetical protein